MFSFISVYSSIKKQKFDCVIGDNSVPMAMAAKHAGIPYFLLTPAPPFEDVFNNTVHIIPSFADTTVALVEVAEAYEWKAVEVIYQDDRGIEHIVYCELR